MKKSKLIGISGPSGSGKTFLARQLQNAFLDATVGIIQEDAYYKDLSHLPFEQRTRINYDHPDAFDHGLLTTHTSLLCTGKTIMVPRYDYIHHIRRGETPAKGPFDIVILEGLMIFTIPELRKLLDLKIYLNTAPDICLLRRLKRDIKERGRTAVSVLQQYEQTVRPMSLKFICPSQGYADIVLAAETSDVINELKSALRPFMSDSRD